MENFGKYRGIVTDNKDPLQKGRIKVKVPDVLGDIENWAVPCIPCSGKGPGYFALPEAGAGVWVEFEKGDPSFPIWSGCYMDNGGIPQYESDTTTSPGLKVYQTSRGLIIVVNDKENTVSLNDKNGNVLISIDSGRGIVKLGANYKVVSEGQQNGVGENSVQPVVFGDDLLNYLNQLVATFNIHIHPGEHASPPVPPANPPHPSILSLKVITGE